MNEEFSPELTKLHKPKEQKNKPKKKKLLRPEQLPIEIILFNRAAINFLFLLLLVFTVVINIDTGTLAAASI